jgi:hypothetical protein
VSTGAGMVCGQHQVVTVCLMLRLCCSRLLDGTVKSCRVQTDHVGVHGMHYNCSRFAVDVNHCHMPALTTHPRPLQAASCLYTATMHTALAASVVPCLMPGASWASHAARCRALCESWSTQRGARRLHATAQGSAWSMCQLKAR